MNYSDLHGFENIYLEDSYVLRIDESKNQIDFTVELVLTEEHFLFRLPNKDEQYCYQKGKIRFKDCRSINWISRSNKTFSDKNEEIDLGNIDSFIKENDICSISGDWGEVEISCNEIDIKYLER